MGSKFSCRSAWLALALFVATAEARAQGLTPVENPGPLSLNEPVRQAKSPGDVYIVQLRDPGAANYKGDRAGFAATKPAAGEHLDSNDPAVESYVRYLEQTHDSLLSAIGGGEKLRNCR